MKKVEELFQIPLDDPQWYFLLGMPICEQLEPRFSRVLNHPASPNGEILDPVDQFVLARIYRGRVTGLDQWDGPEVLEDALFLVKHPSIGTNPGYNRGLGETNGLMEYSGYMFGMVTKPDSAFAGRPVVPAFQSELKRKFEISLTAVQRELISPYRGIQGAILGTP